MYFGEASLNPVPVGISEMNTEFHKIFSFLGRVILKGASQKAQKAQNVSVN
jgi:hypothetical protein